MVKAIFRRVILTVERACMNNLEMVVGVTFIKLIILVKKN